MCRFEEQNVQGLFGNKRQQQKTTIHILRKIEMYSLLATCIRKNYYYNIVD